MERIWYLLVQTIENLGSDPAVPRHAEETPMILLSARMKPFLLTGRCFLRRYKFLHQETPELAK